MSLSYLFVSGFLNLLKLLPFTSTLYNTLKSKQQIVARCDFDFDGSFEVTNPVFVIHPYFAQINPTQIDLPTLLSILNFSIPRITVGILSVHE